MDNAEILILLGLLMAIGFIAGAIGEKLGAPRVALYVLVGALFSNEFLGRFFDVVGGRWDALLTDIALSAIAFLLGAEFHLKWLKTKGKTIGYGLAGQFCGAILFVSIGMITYCLVCTEPITWRLAVVLAAIAAATAPAATVAVIEEYHARGPLTQTLFGIVAIDDALAIVAFTIALNLAASNGRAHEYARAGIEIGGALVLGALLGVALGWFGRRIHEEELRLPVILGFIFVTLGLARHFGLSVLLASIVLGFVSKLMFRHKTEQWIEPMNHIREAIFVIFFTIAGTHFHAPVFVRSLGFIAAYVLLRTGGKMLGAYAGLRLAGAPAAIRQYAGLALLPQAGVSIGLALTAIKTPPLSDYKSLILNTIVGSTILFELVAPIASKWALQRAGEITPHREHTHRLQG